MFLLVTATEQEMRPLALALEGVSGWTPLVAGVGCLETAVRLTRWLAGGHVGIRGVINCGVAGAFVGAGPGLLDLCLATEETQADVGVGTALGVTDFETMLVPSRFPLDPLLGEDASRILSAGGMRPWLGPFLSVLAVSGTETLGQARRQRYQAICENMEGAAVARVAAEFALPCLEMRAISNLVVDRDRSQWQMTAALGRLAQAMAILLPGLGG